MDFAFTEEQTLLRNSVARFIAEKYAFETRREIVKSAEGWREDYWRQFAELGLLAAPFAEEHGGLGGSAIEVMIVMEEFGRGLVVEPFAPTIVLGGGFLRHAGSPAHREAHIPAIIEGKRRFAFAYAERQARYDLFDIHTTARRQGQGYQLAGEKGVVIGGPLSDHLIVTARTGGGQREKGGISLFLVDARAKGVSQKPYTTVDGLRASEITFENVALGAEALLGPEGGAYPVIERVTDEAIAALCAEAMGVFRTMTTMTVDYTRTRKQFGQPLSKFQVLQHRMVDMFMHCEETVSMTYMATLKLGAPDGERAKAVSAAKAQMGRAGRFIGQSAVQLHGGMGVTEEMAVGHYFKRATMLASMLGDVDHHLRRFEG